MFSPSTDSSFAMYPAVKASTRRVSNFLVTCPNVGLLDIFLFYKNIEKIDPNLYD